MNTIPSNIEAVLSGKFLDVRNHGFFRVAAITPMVSLANPAKNAEYHIEALKQVYAEGAMYAVGPELGLTGYSCGDLFKQQTLQDAAMAALEVILQRTQYMNMMFTVGMPMVVADKLFNVAVTCVMGDVVAVTPKAYPPEYREFYEARYFALASESDCNICRIPFEKLDKTLLGELERLSAIGDVGDAVCFMGNYDVPYDVPFGTDILINWPEANENFVLHTSICEDLWVPIPPSTIAALHGATVLANLSASNIIIGKSDYREHLVVDSSARNNAVQIYSAAGIGESTNDLAWDGDAYIAECGDILARSERFAPKGGYIIADADLPMLVQERISQNSFRANRSDNSKDFRYIEWRKMVNDRNDRTSIYGTIRREIDPMPFVPSDPAKRDERCYETFMIQATALAGKLKSLPESMRKVYVGVSGGLDSTQALLVAVHAMKLLGIPKSNIYGITMPGFGTTKRTKSNADKLVIALGATYGEISIKQAVQARFDRIGYDPEVHGYGVTYENIQAWERFQVLLDLSSKTGAIVLGTGDLSELCLGWCTMYGDHSSHYGVNAGVPKTLIRYLIDWAKDHIFEDAEIQQVLSDILATPISPELLPPGKDGEIVQMTEEKVGPYELHDFFIYWTIRHGCSPTKIARMAMQAFEGKYSLTEIKKWLRVFVSRFFANQFKRNVMPEGPKVGLVTVNPRGDWRMPSDAVADAWLAEVELIPDEIDEGTK